MDATTGPVQKKCNRCKQVDVTEFSKCRYCGVAYDYVPPKNTDGFGADVRRFVATPLGMTLFALIIIGPILAGFRNAIIYYMVHKSVTTIQETGRELKLDPNDVDAHLRRADALKTAFLYWDAVNECTAALKVTPTAAIYRKRADMYECAGNGELAKADRAAAASLEHH